MCSRIFGPLFGYLFILLYIFLDIKLRFWVSVDIVSFDIRIHFWDICLFFGVHILILNIVSIRQLLGLLSNFALIVNSQIILGNFALALAWFCII